MNVLSTEKHLSSTCSANYSAFTGISIKKQLNEFVPFWHCGDIRYRRYNEENPEPNLSYRSTAIRWYKHPGRGMTVNKNMDTQQWVNWFEMCLEHMHIIEKAHYIKQGILTHGTIKGIKPTSPE